MLITVVVYSSLPLQIQGTLRCNTNYQAIKHQPMKLLHTGGYMQEKAVPNNEIEGLSVEICSARVSILYFAFWFLPSTTP